MVEQSRFEYLNKLKREGFTKDVPKFYEKEIVLGGPEFLKSPDGKIHWVSCEKHGPINGEYLKDISETHYVKLTFRDGILEMMGLPREKENL